VEPYRLYHNVVFQMMREILSWQTCHWALIQRVDSNSSVNWESRKERETTRVEYGSENGLKMRCAKNSVTCTSSRASSSVGTHTLAVFTGLRGGRLCCCCCCCCCCSASRHRRRRHAPLQGPRRNVEAQLLKPMPISPFAGGEGQRVTGREHKRRIKTTSHTAHRAIAPGSCGALRPRGGQAAVLRLGSSGGMHLLAPLDLGAIVIKMDVPPPSVEELGRSVHACVGSTTFSLEGKGKDREH